MLAIVEPARVDEVVRYLHYAGIWTPQPIGTVTEGPDLVATMRRRRRGRGRSARRALLADRGAALRRAARPGSDARAGPRARPRCPEPDDLGAGRGLDRCCADPNVGSTALDLRAVRPPRRREHHGRRPGGDAAVVRRARQRAGDRDHHRLRRAPLRGRPPRRGRGERCSRPPATSPRSARAPIAATDCLNFPNPEKGSTGWRLARGHRGHVRGVGGAWRCRSSRATSRSTTRAQIG